MVRRNMWETILDLDGSTYHAYIAQGSIGILRENNPSESQSIDISKSITAYQWIHVTTEPSEKLVSIQWCRDRDNVQWHGALVALVAKSSEDLTPFGRIYRPHPVSRVIPRGKTPNNPHWKVFYEWKIDGHGPGIEYLGWRSSHPDSGDRFHPPEFISLERETGWLTFWKCCPLERFTKFDHASSKSQDHHTQSNTAKLSHVYLNDIVLMEEKVAQFNVFQRRQRQSPSRKSHESLALDICAPSPDHVFLITGQVHDRVLTCWSVHQPLNPGDLERSLLSHDRAVELVQWHHGHPGSSSVVCTFDRGGELYIWKRRRKSREPWICLSRLRASRDITQVGWVRSSTRFDIPMNHETTLQCYGLDSNSNTMYIWTTIVDQNNPGGFGHRICTTRMEESSFGLSATFDQVYDVLVSQEDGSSKSKSYYILCQLKSQLLRSSHPLVSGDQEQNQNEPTRSRVIKCLSAHQTSIKSFRFFFNHHRDSFPLHWNERLCFGTLDRDTLCIWQWNSRDQKYDIQSTKCLSSMISSVLSPPHVIDLVMYSPEHMVVSQSNGLVVVLSMNQLDPVEMLDSSSDECAKNGSRFVQKGQGPPQVWTQLTCLDFNFNDSENVYSSLTCGMSGSCWRFWSFSSVNTRSACHSNATSVDVGTGEAGESSQELDQWKFMIVSTTVSHSIRTFRILHFDSVTQSFSLYLVQWNLRKVLAIEKLWTSKQSLQRMSNELITLNLNPKISAHQQQLCKPVIHNHGWKIIDFSISSTSDSTLSESHRISMLEENEALAQVRMTILMFEDNEWIGSNSEACFIFPFTDQNQMSVKKIFWISASMFLFFCGNIFRVFQLVFFQKWTETTEFQFPIPLVSFAPSSSSSVAQEPTISSNSFGCIRLLKSKNGHVLFVTVDSSFFGMSISPYLPTGRVFGSPLKRSKSMITTTAEKDASFLFLQSLLHYCYNGKWIVVQFLLSAFVFECQRWKDACFIEMIHTLPEQYQKFSFFQYQGHWKNKWLMKAVQCQSECGVDYTVMSVPSSAKDSHEDREGYHLPMLSFGDMFDQLFTKKNESSSSCPLFAYSTSYYNQNECWLILKHLVHTFSIFQPHRFQSVAQIQFWLHFQFSRISSSAISISSIWIALSFGLCGRKRSQGDQDNDELSRAMLALISPLLSSSSKTSDVASDSDVTSVSYMPPFSGLLQCIIEWKLPLWIPTLELQKILEQLAKEQYLKHKNPLDCALTYVLLQKFAMMSQLLKLSAKTHSNVKQLMTMSKWFSSIASSIKSKSTTLNPYRTSILKNAFVCQSKQQYLMAATLFYSVHAFQEAIRNCWYHDPSGMLALVMTRMIPLIVTSATAGSSGLPSSNDESMSVAQSNPNQWELDLVQQLYDQEMVSFSSSSSNRRTSSSSSYHRPDVWKCFSLEWRLFSLDSKGSEEERQRLMWQKCGHVLSFEDLSRTRSTFYFPKSWIVPLLLCLSRPDEEEENKSTLLIQSIHVMQTESLTLAGLKTFQELVAAHQMMSEPPFLALDLGVQHQARHVVIGNKDEDKGDDEIPLARIAQTQDRCHVDQDQEPSSFRCCYQSQSQMGGVFCRNLNPDTDLDFHQFASCSATELFSFHIAKSRDISTLNQHSKASQICHTSTEFSQATQNVRVPSSDDLLIESNDAHSFRWLLNVYELNPRSRRWTHIRISLIL